MRHLRIVILLFFSAVAYAQPGYLLHNSYSRNVFLLDSLRQKDFFQHPGFEDSVDVIEAWARRHDDRQLALQLHLLKYRLLLTSGKQIAVEEFSANLTSVLMEAERYHMKYLLAEANQALGDLYWNVRGKYGRSLECYLAAYQFYSRLTAAEFPMKQSDLYAFGTLYYSYEEFENAVKLLNEANRTAAMNTIVEKPLKNTLGLCYMRLGRYDSAEFFFNAIYSTALRQNDSVWESLSSGNIGTVYFRQGRYSEAIPRLRKDIDLSYTTHMVKNAAISSWVLSQIYYAQKKYDSARCLLLLALKRIEEKNFWPDYILAARFYRQLHLVYEAQGDIVNSNLYADSALMAADSSAAASPGVALARAQENADFERHKADVAALNAEKEVQRMFSYALIAGIVALCSISILLVNRQKVKNRILTGEKKLAEAELENAGKQLNDFTRHLQEKGTLLEQFSEELERYRKNEERAADDETLMRLQQATILTDTQWEDFRALFEKVHRGFFIRLKEKMPDLTPGEIRFMALARLKLSSKEMMAILGISGSTIRNYRMRLRRRLGLDDEASIEEIADAV